MVILHTIGHISTMTFIDVTIQYGVHSVGTLYRECMVRVVFHHERLYEIEKSLVSVIRRMCYKPKRIQLCITKDSMGRVSDQCPFNNRKQYWKKQLIQS